jgi:hypothetical protein
MTLPALTELLTESDVEQKLIWPLLVRPYPMGLGLGTPDIATKLNVRRLEIGKGTARKLYFPDYIVIIGGLPVAIVEAKAPGESVEQGLDEARLYANEVNARFPTSINPIFRVIACNGERLVSCPVDSAEPDILLTHADFVVTDPAFARFIDLCRRDALQRFANEIRKKLRRDTYQRPLSLVGGQSVQNQELPPNTFGVTIAGDYGHVFNPRTRDDRIHIVRNAYVSSLRRQRYVEPIDRVIRNAVTPAMAQIPMMEDTSKPKEILEALRERRALENQIILLIGGVGVGKSTFVDYLSGVALPEDVRSRTIWLRLNLNEAPLSIEMAYAWVVRGVIAEIRSQFPEIDFDDITILEKVFSPELNSLLKGPLALLDPGSTEHRTRLTDRMMAWQSEGMTMAKAMARYVCAGPGRLLVIALDNCDKRDRDHQLAMFQVAQWVQNEFRALVVLPIRDVTFELHRSEPPLDTAQKHLVFRIEPPNFAEVLQNRVRLALEEMKAAEKDIENTLTFQLPNGMKVTYPASDQGVYLASILRSLYAHDRFVRQVMTGLAGRDVRRALEIFLDFCMSGHIGEDEIYKIRFFRGAYVLPLTVIARVLLRMQRRFYDGDKSHLKNLIQCVPTDALPDHFVRLGILHWLDARKERPGPAGVNGFHRVSDVLTDLVRLGHDVLRAREELLYLIRERCIVVEHLRADSVDDGDLVRITAAGVVHLQLMASPDYLAACAEDTWLSDSALAQDIAERLRGPQNSHLSRRITARTARELVEYLKARAAERVIQPQAYLSDEAAVDLRILGEAEAAIAAAEIEVSKRLFVGNLPWGASETDIRAAFGAIGVTPARIAIPIDREAGRNKGYAFVDVDTGGAAMTALDAEGTLKIHGRQLRIGEANVQDEEHQATGTRVSARLSDRLYVSNLAYSLNEAGLAEAFAAHDLRAMNIYLPRDRATGRSRGYAFVSMASVDEAARAIGALNGAVVGGRKINVRPADPPEEDRN